jgi:hypothetical protein
VREPLDWYISFYRWGVGFRQRDNPDRYGRTFLEWVEKVPNLQSTMLVASMASYPAEYKPKSYRRQFERHEAVGRSPRSAWKVLQALLDQFAIVGTVERFDETMLLAHDLLGLPVTLYKRNRPKQKNGYGGSRADVCPDAEACRKLVRRVAARDHKMYDVYKERFEARLSRLGATFERRVVLYKEAIAASQPLWRRAPRRQYLCRFHAVESRRAAPNTAAANRPDIRCPLGSSRRGHPPTAERAALDAACASVFAHRLFECPWQYVANSSLTDGLGCWRPSSGIK